MTSTLFSGGTVVSAEASFAADVLVVDGRIAAIGSALPVSADQRVNCDGRLLLPGGVDVHTYLDAPLMGTTTADDFGSGTRAAACGGTTTIVDFALQVKGQRIPETLALYHDKADGKATIDYGFHIAVTNLYDGAIADLGSVVDDGVTSFKIFMAYRGLMMLNDGEMFDVLREAGRRGAEVCVHAENGDVIDRMAADLVAQGKTEPRYHAVSRPPSTEVEAVRRAIQISRVADAPVYFVHLSTSGAAEAVAAARQEDWPVSAETCTHYLTLGPELYDRPDSRFSSCTSASGLSSRCAAKLATVPTPLSRTRSLRASPGRFCTTLASSRRAWMLICSTTLSQPPRGAWCSSRPVVTKDTGSTCGPSKN